MVPGFKAKEIKPTKTVGQRLKAARLRRQLSLEDAERLTKVKLKYLEALEEDRHDLLPTEVYSLGFLRCYGEALRLNTKKLLEQYRLERQALKSAKKQTAQQLAPARRLSGPKFLLTPKTLFTLGSAVLVVGLLAYIASGIHGFLAPPKLRVDEPKPDSRVAESSLNIAGETDPAVSLTVNGELITVDPSGQFKREIALMPGLNNVELVATNRIGKETRLIRKVLADYQVTPSPSPSGEASPSPAVSPSPSPTNSSSPTPRVSASPKASPSPTPTTKE